MAETATVAVGELSFEKALEELEKIVARLERGEVPLAEVDGVTEAFELAQETAGVRDARPVMEVIGPEVFVGDAIFKHVIDRSEERGGDRADRFLWTAPAFQTQEEGLQVGALFVFGS